MKSIDINVKITATYDFVTFNGDNVDEVIAFVKEHHINGEDEDFWELRPDDIPNLDYQDLIKWWESTGEVKKNRWGGEYNTHTFDNLPIWRKDEFLRIIVKGDRSGYVRHAYMMKGESIITIGNEFFFENNWDESTIKDIIEERINSILP